MIHNLEPARDLSEGEMRERMARDYDRLADAALERAILRPDLAGHCHIVEDAYRAKAASLRQGSPQ